MLQSLPLPGETRGRAVLVTVGLLCLAGPGWALSPPEVFAAAAPSVAVLEVLDRDGRSAGSYTATQIDGGRFVSVCEVLDGAGAVRITVGSRVRVGKVAARDRERNLCLVRVDGTGGTGIALQGRVPATGSRVFAISNALGLGVGISEGVVSGVRHYPAGDYIQFTAPISPGSEGGALVDENGALVGVIDYRRRDGQNVNFASLATWVADIETRAAEGAETLKRYDAAMALAQQGKWAELDVQASEWTRRQADSVDAWRFYVSAARGLKNRDKEIVGWRALRRISPDNAETGAGLGYVLMNGGQLKEALELAKTLVATHREYAVARWLLARARHLSGLYREAEASYREAIDLDPWLMEAYQGLATLAQSRGDHATAISIWSRIAGLYPDAPGPRFGLVQAYLNAGKADRAHAVLERLPEKDRDSAAAWYWRGFTQARLARPEAAVKAYRESLERKFEAADRAWAGIGYAMNGMRRYPEAIAAFQSAQAANPDDDEWRYQLGVVLKDGGRPGEALKIFDTLVAKAPGEARNWRQQGFTLAVLGRQTEAVPALERSLQLDPAQAKVWMALLESNQALGRRDAAIEAYEKLRAIDGGAAEQAYRNTLAPYEEKAR
jgi:tetratricopeptide (TPR) repeat protein